MVTDNADSHAAIDVLIADVDAEIYAQLLGQTPAVAGRYIRVQVAAAGAHGPATVCRIALGQPDYIAQQLRSGARFAWVQSTWAGITPLLADDLPRDYTLTGLSGIFGPWIAEYVLAYLLQFDQQLLQRRAAQQQQHWQPRLPRRLRERRIAVLGTGEIGSAVAQALRALGCSVTGINRSGGDTACFDAVAPVTALHRVLITHDTLINTLPDTPATRGLLDAAAFAAMPAGSTFINVGRGTVVAEAVLIAALQCGQLAAAVLDVTQPEPLPLGHPFWTMPQVQLSYHTAGPSRPTEIVPQFLANLQRFLRDEPLLRVIDFQQGY